MPRARAQRGDEFRQTDDRQSQVGAGPDLVDDEKNGFVVPVEHVAMLADRLRCLTDNL